MSGFRINLQMDNLDLRTQDLSHHSFYRLSTNNGHGSAAVNGTAVEWLMFRDYLRAFCGSRWNLFTRTSLFYVLGATASAH